MDIETLGHMRAEGWSGAFPDWDSDRTLVTVFGASDCLRDPSAIAALMAAFPRSHVVGCSTSGEILETTINDDSLAVAICRFEHTRLRSFAVPVKDNAGSREAGRRLAGALAGPELRSMLVFSDGLSVNGSELLAGINQVLPPSVIVTGGLAGDGDRFQRTWVIADGAPRSSWISGLGLYGDRVRVGHGSKGGWDAFGPERVVTKSRGNVLFEIDGRPALALYKDYLGDRAAGLPGTALLFPLALRASRGATKSLVRTILSIDEAAQSMTFAGDIPEGYRAQLMRANFDRLVAGASEAARLTSQGSTDATVSLALAISCVGRRLVLGQRAEEEVEAAREALPRGARLLGFYSYGEISPYATGACDLHNQTMTLTNIEER
jgi:hypothetical protein